MKTSHPYIVLHRGMRLNPTKDYAVVHLKEWVAVALGEKETYTFISQHPDYTSADAECDRLNHQPAQLPPCPPRAASPKRPGISLTRKQKAAT
jgi:hypothetical protein